MSYYGYYVERQGWTHWPKVLIMCHHTGDGHDEKRRYVPERTCSLVKEHFGRSGASCRLVCSECHHVIYDGWQEKPRYCAFCGAEVRR